MIPVIEHDPEKWKPVFGKDHAPIRHLSKHAFCAGHRRPVNLALRSVRNGQAVAFPRRLRARVLPTPLSKIPRSPIASCQIRRWDRCSARSRSVSRSPDGAKRNPGTIDQLYRRSRISLRFIRATKKIKGSGTPTDASSTMPCQRARPRAKRRALACRRSTTALAAATERHRSAPVHALPGTVLVRDGRYPSPAVPVQRAI